MDGLAAAAGVLPAFLVVGLTTSLTTRAAARGHLVRGGLIGIRTRATRRSDAAWEAGHRAAERSVRWCSLVCAVAAAAVLVVGLAGGSEEGVLLTAAAGGAAVLALLAVAVRRADVAASLAGDRAGDRADSAR